MSETAPSPTKRHGLVTRLWHWLNFASVTVLFMSGLNISNAHRYLYWGHSGFDPSQAWLAVPRFPGWATIPGYYDLAAARDWHILAAWFFAVGLLVMWVVLLFSGRFWREMRTSPAEWTPKAIARSIASHWSLKFVSSGTKYNFLQRVAYGTVLGIFLPMMIISGLAISPGIEPAAPWLVDMFGGRQGARSVHFIVTWATVTFFAVHIIAVLVSGPIKQIGEMITGGGNE